MKKIIISFDGTGNEADDAEQQRSFFGFGRLKDGSITNVLKMHLLFGGNLENTPASPNQHCFYYKGVGTYGNLFQRAINAAFSPRRLDLNDIMNRAQEDLEANYEDGDELFLFGFSRGAAIARKFASKLDEFSLSGAPSVKFLGVFDTVASIGVPNLNNKSMPISDVKFENCTVSSNVREALHLLSIDDRRKAFQPTLMNRDKRIKEVWFSGAHSDVGGGYRQDGLSDIALQYMLEYVSAHGFGIKKIHPGDINYESLAAEGEDSSIGYADVVVNPNYLGKNHQQRRTPFVTKATLAPRFVGVFQDDKLDSNYKPIVHESVLKRIDEDLYYRPKALENVELIVEFGDEKEEAFSGLKEMYSFGWRPLKTIPPGEAKKVRVHATEQYNWSGILMSRGERYIFDWNEEEVWYDADIRCGVRGWTGESAGLGFMKKLFVRQKEDDRRLPSAEWCELVASIGRSDRELIQILRHGDVANAYEVESDGEFCPFANDLMNRYRNNMGYVDIFVKREA